MSSVNKELFNICCYLRILKRIKVWECVLFVDEKNNKYWFLQIAVSQGIIAACFFSTVNVSILYDEQLETLRRSGRFSAVNRLNVCNVLH